MEELGKRLQIKAPKIVTVHTADGDHYTVTGQAMVKMAKRWDDAVIAEIKKEADLAGMTEVTVLNGQEILAALREYLARRNNEQPIVPGRREDDHTITEMAFRNGAADMKQRILDKLGLFREIARGYDRALIRELMEAIGEMEEI